MEASEKKVASINCCIVIVDVGIVNKPASRRKAKASFSLLTKRNAVDGKICGLLIEFSAQKSKVKIEIATVKRYNMSFIKEGKLTIRCGSPMRDIFVSEVHPDTLIRFAKLLRGGGAATSSGDADTRIQSYETMLTITSRAAFKSLREEKYKKLLSLTMTNVKDDRIEPRVLEIASLHNLSITGNQLGFVPMQAFIRLVRLTSLYLPSNSIKALPGEAFCGGLQFTLVLLDLSRNEASSVLKVLPPQIFHMKKLRVLNVESNSLTELPSTIGSALNLRELNMMKNPIDTYPEQMLRISFDVVSVSFRSIKASDQKPDFEKTLFYPCVLPLKLLVAERLLNSKKNPGYPNIPVCLNSFLSEAKRCSICFRLFFMTYGKKRKQTPLWELLQSLKAREFRSDGNQQQDVINVEHYACSEKCYKKLL